MPARCKQTSSDHRWGLGEALGMSGWLRVPSCHRCISMDSASFGRYLILLKSSQVLILNAVKDPKVIPFRCLPNPIEPELWRARVHHDHPLRTGVKEGLACWFPKQPNIYSNSLVFEKSREHHLHIGMEAGGQELYELLESSGLETHCRQIDVIFLLVFPCQASFLVVPVRFLTIDAMFDGPLAPFPHPTWPPEIAACRATYSVRLCPCPAVLATLEARGGWSTTWIAKFRVSCGRGPRMPKASRFCHWVCKKWFPYNLRPQFKPLPCWFTTNITGTYGR